MEPDTLTCRHCGGELAADERVSRSIGLAINEAGEIDYAPEILDDVAWETSETVGVICQGCAIAEPVLATDADWTAAVLRLAGRA